MGAVSERREADQMDLEVLRVVCVTLQLADHQARKERENRHSHVYQQRLAVQALDSVQRPYHIRIKESNARFPKFTQSMNRTAEEKNTR